MTKAANLPIRFASAPAKVGETRTENGQLVATATKEIVQAGSWWKDGRPLEIPQSRLSHWKNQFDLMLASGMKVPIPVDHTRDPEANRGWVTGMQVVGDKLVATMELIGEDSIKLAARSDVSIQACDLTDNKGKVYEDAIEHAAMVTDPFITGLNKFMIQLSRAKTLGLSIGGSSMEYLKKIADAMGIEVGEMDEAALSDAIMAAYGKMKEGEKEVEVKLAAATSEVATLKLSAKPADAIDPDLLRAESRNIKLELDALVLSRQITPAVRDLSTAFLCSAKSPVVMLSAKAATAAGLEGPLADKFLNILKEMPKPTGSGPTTSLSREGGNKEGDVDHEAVNKEVKKILGK